MDELLQKLVPHKRGDPAAEAAQLLDMITVDMGLGKSPAVGNPHHPQLRWGLAPESLPHVACHKDCPFGIFWDWVSMFFLAQFGEHCIVHCGVLDLSVCMFGKHYIYFLGCSNRAAMQLCSGRVTTNE